MVNRDLLNYLVVEEKIFIGNLVHQFMNYLLNNFSLDRSLHLSGSSTLIGLMRLYGCKNLLKT